MSDSKSAILDAAVDILRDPHGPALTLESAARGAGLTKPGLMYHYPTKQALVHAVIEHAMRGWSARFAEQLGAPLGDAPARERIAAYVRAIAAADFDLADLAVLFQVRYRAATSELWMAWIEPWLEVPDDVPAPERARLTAARLAADGLWYATASGWPVRERAATAAVILGLLDG
jgi:AcrR family transcriptional regulator